MGLPHWSQNFLSLARGLRTLEGHPMVEVGGNQALSLA